MIVLVVHHFVKHIQEILTMVSVFHVFQMLIVKVQHHIVKSDRALNVMMTLTVQPLSKQLFAHYPVIMQAHVFSA
jgi:hypothetical protein